MKLSGNVSKRYRDHNNFRHFICSIFIQTIDRQMSSRSYSNEDCVVSSLASALVTSGCTSRAGLSSVTRSADAPINAALLFYAAQYTAVVCCMRMLYRRLPFQTIIISCNLLIALIILFFQFQNFELQFVH